MNLGSFWWVISFASSHVVIVTEVIGIAWILVGFVIVEKIIIHVVKSVVTDVVVACYRG